jgi:hypothetical protein
MSMAIPFLVMVYIKFRNIRKNNTLKVFITFLELKLLNLKKKKKSNQNDFEIIFLKETIKLKSCSILALGGLTIIKF